MIHKHLKNKPLVEALVELEWALQEQGPQRIKTDPYYKMALGRFYERVMNEYPQHETLAAANFPETMVYHTAQHLFRVGRGRWPAIQMGPGILSIHERDEYEWNDFARRTEDALRKLFDSYPKGTDFNVEALRLHYTDAVNLDFTRENVNEPTNSRLMIWLCPSSQQDGHPEDIGYCSFVVQQPLSKIFFGITRCLN